MPLAVMAGRSPPSNSVAEGVGATGGTASGTAAAMSWSAARPRARAASLSRAAAMYRSTTGTGGGTTAGFGGAGTMAGLDLGFDFLRSSQPGI